MSNYVMERGWQDSPFFDGDEYSRRDAWEWLISHACYEEKKSRISGKIVSLKRGQLSYSIRFLAERWGWSKSRVSRFIDSLIFEAMIETDIGTGQLIITLCNYEKYQLSPKKSGTKIEVDSGTAAGQQRDSSGTNNNTGNNNSEDKSSSYSPPQHKLKNILPEWLPNEPWEAWVEMRKKIRAPLTDYAIKLAIGELDRLRSQGHDPTECINLAVSKNWKSFYAPKKSSPIQEGSTNGKSSSGGASPLHGWKDAWQSVIEESHQRQQSELGELPISGQLSLSHTKNSEELSDLLGGG